MGLMDEMEAVLVSGSHSFISITGGGGKTTFMSAFGSYLRDKGLCVLITTTTKVMSPRLYKYGQDIIFSGESVLGFRPDRPMMVFYAEKSTMDMKKWLSPREEVLSALYGYYDVIISEADGSRGLPLKIHTERDPVIHPLTTATVAVIGAWGIGDKIYSAVFGDGREGIVDAHYLDWYLHSEEGLTKGMAGKKAILINGAESLSDDKLSILRGLEYPVQAYAVSMKEDRIIEKLG